MTTTLLLRGVPKHFGMELCVSASPSGRTASAVGINMPMTHPSQCKQPLTELLSPNIVFLSLLFLSSLNPFRSPGDLCWQS